MTTGKFVRVRVCTASHKKKSMTCDPRQGTIIRAPGGRARPAEGQTGRAAALGRRCPSSAETRAGRTRWGTYWSCGAHSRACPCRPVTSAWTASAARRAGSSPAAASGKSLARRRSPPGQGGAVGVQAATASRWCERPSSRPRACLGGGDAVPPPPRAGPAAPSRRRRRRRPRPRAGRRQTARTWVSCVTADARARAGRVGP